MKLQALNCQKLYIVGNTVRNWRQRCPKFWANFCEKPRIEMSLVQNAIQNNTKQTSFFPVFFREIAHFKYNQKFVSFQL